MRNMRFKRIQKSAIPSSADISDPEVLVRDDGFCWRRFGQRYICEGLLQDPGSKLIDVSGEPTCRQGSEGDVAVSPDGRWWKLDSDLEWMFQGFLVPCKPENLIVNELRIRGNFKPPVVNGRIPVYDSQDVLIGYLTLEPVE